MIDRGESTNYGEVDVLITAAVKNKDIEYLKKALRICNDTYPTSSEEKKLAIRKKIFECYVLYAAISGDCDLAEEISTWKRFRDEMKHFTWMSGFEYLEAQFFLNPSNNKLQSQHDQILYTYNVFYYAFKNLNCITVDKQTTLVEKFLSKIEIYKDNASILAKRNLQNSMRECNKNNDPFNKKVFSTAYYLSAILMTHTCFCDKGNFISDISDDYKCNVMSAHLNGKLRKDQKDNYKCIQKNKIVEVEKEAAGHILEIFLCSFPMVDKTQAIQIITHMEKYLEELLKQDQQNKILDKLVGHINKGLNEFYECYIPIDDLQKEFVGDNSIYSLKLKKDVLKKLIYDLQNCLNGITHYQCIYIILRLHKNILNVYYMLIKIDGENAKDYRIKYIENFNKYCSQADDYPEISSIYDININLSEFVKDLKSYLNDIKSSVKSIRSSPTKINVDFNNELIVTNTRDYLHYIMENELGIDIFKEAYLYNRTNTLSENIGSIIENVVKKIQEGQNDKAIHCYQAIEQLLETSGIMSLIGEKIKFIVIDAKLSAIRALIEQIKVENRDLEKENVEKKVNTLLKKYGYQYITGACILNDKYNQYNASKDPYFLDSLNTNIELHHKNEGNLVKAEYYINQGLSVDKENIFLQQRKVAIGKEIIKSNIADIRLQLNNIKNKIPSVKKQINDILDLDKSNNFKNKLENQRNCMLNHRESSIVLLENNCQKVLTKLTEISNIVYPNSTTIKDIQSNLKIIEQAKSDCNKLKTDLDMIKSDGEIIETALKKYKNDLSKLNQQEKQVIADKAKIEKNKKVIEVVKSPELPPKDINTKEEKPNVTNNKGKSNTNVINNKESKKKNKNININKNKNQKNKKNQNKKVKNIEVNINSQEDKILDDTQIKSPLGKTHVVCQAPPVSFSATITEEFENEKHKQEEVNNNLETNNSNQESIQEKNTNQTINDTLKNIESDATVKTIDNDKSDNNVFIEEKTNVVIEKCTVNINKNYSIKSSKVNSNATEKAVNFSLNDNNNNFFTRKNNNNNIRPKTNVKTIQNITHDISNIEIEPSRTKDKEQHVSSKELFHTSLNEKKGAKTQQQNAPMEDEIKEFQQLLDRLYKSELIVDDNNIKKYIQQSHCLKKISKLSDINKFLEDMLKISLIPNDVIFSQLIEKMILLNMTEQAYSILMIADKRDLSNSHAYGYMIVAITKSKEPNVDLIIELFNKAKGKGLANSFIYNHAITAIANREEPNSDLAIDLCLEACEKNLANMSTYTRTLKAIKQSKTLNVIKIINFYKQTKLKGFANDYTYIVIFDAIVRNNPAAEPQFIKELMTEALKYNLFKQLKFSAISPNSIIYLKHDFSYGFSYLWLKDQFSNLLKQSNQPITFKIIIEKSLSHTSELISPREGVNKILEEMKDQIEYQQDTNNDIFHVTVGAKFKIDNSKNVNNILYVAGKPFLINVLNTLNELNNELLAIVDEKNHSIGYCSKIKGSVAAKLTFNHFGHHNIAENWITNDLDLHIGLIRENKDDIKMILEIIHKYGFTNYNESEYNQNFKADFEEVEVDLTLETTSKYQTYGYLPLPTMEFINIKNEEKVKDESEEKIIVNYDKHFFEIKGPSEFTKEEFKDACNFIKICVLDPSPHFSQYLYRIHNYLEKMKISGALEILNSSPNYSLATFYQELNPKLIKHFYSQLALSNYTCFKELSEFIKKGIQPISIDLALPLISSFYHALIKSMYENGKSINDSLLNYIIDPNNPEVGLDALAKECANHFCYLINDNNDYTDTDYMQFILNITNDIIRKKYHEQYYPGNYHHNNVTNQLNNDNKRHNHSPGYGGPG